MASEIQPVDKDNSEEMTPSTSNESSTNAVFMPKDTLDQPCDIFLVVEDGKQFKAHRKVLSEASPFFEKLLNSDMKESKEAIVRLEMFSESVMAATLEFIYTGHVQILTEDNARDLIVVADYLLLQKLKTLAEGVLAQKLNILNCISTYYFSEIYQCKELVSETKKFILANFTAVYTANREDVLNLSSKEVEMWISSNELNVSAEEDVFKIILAWIDHDKSKRKEYFAELFRQVRLVYVSRDFLSSDVVTNDLVKENEDCLDLVKDTISLIDSKNCNGLSFPPRKSLETTAIVMRKDKDFVCYFPDEDNWYRLCEIPSEYRRSYTFFPCEGKLYSIARSRVPLLSDMISFSPYSNIWMQLPNLGEDKYLWKIFVGNEHEMYALVSEICFSCKYITNDSSDRKHSCFISRYKPESHSWENVLSFDPLYPYVREKFCIVASDRFIYFIGGVRVKGINCDIHGKEYVFLRDVDRYDLMRHQYDKVADIQVARKGAQGVAVNGKVFIAGGDHQGRLQYLCEMYDETTNEWQFIASCRDPKAAYNLLVVDSKLYSVYFAHEIQSPGECTLPRRVSVEFYDPEKNEWTMKSEITSSLPWGSSLNACSMGIFKGISHIRQLESLFPDRLAGANTTRGTSLHDHKRVKQKCFII